MWIQTVFIMSQFRVLNFERKQSLFFPVTWPHCVLAQVVIPFPTNFSILPYFFTAELSVQFNSVTLLVTEVVQPTLRTCFRRGNGSATMGRDFVHATRFQTETSNEILGLRNIRLYHLCSSAGALNQGSRPGTPDIHLIRKYEEVIHQPCVVVFHPLHWFLSCPFGFESSWALTFVGYAVSFILRCLYSWVQEAGKVLTTYHSDWGIQCNV